MRSCVALHFKEEVMHDGILLMDRAMASKHAPGVPMLPLTAAACLLISAQQGRSLPHHMHHLTSFPWKLVIPPPPPAQENCDWVLRRSHMLTTAACLPSAAESAEQGGPLPQCLHHCLCCHDGIIS